MGGSGNCGRKEVVEGEFDQTESAGVVQTRLDIGEIVVGRQKNVLKTRSNQISGDG